MPELILLVGNVGSGKSTLCKEKYPSYTRVSQDEQGKNAHKKVFTEALSRNENIIVDRQNHLREQREYFLSMGKENNYTTKIIWLKVDKALCERRILSRKDHPTISNKDNVRSIVNSYAGSLETPIQSEADVIVELETKYYAPVQDLTHLKGKIAVIGDPHGVWKELKDALDEIKPDHVVYVGDMVDRGPNINEVLQHAQKNYSVIGNHEDKFSRVLLGNKVSMSGGIEKTIAQTSHYTEDEKKDLYNWIQTLPYIIKLPKDYVVVHAGLDPTRPLEKQYCDTCIYIRNYGSKKMDDPSVPRWYQHELCDDLKKYKILFGHAIHEECNVAPNIYSLDKGAVYGTGLRIMVIDTEGEDQVKEFETETYYETTAWNPLIKREEYVKQGKLSKSEYEDLVLYNYTDSVTFSREWDDITLSSRGTIYNKSNGHLVGLSMSKFFNLNEHESTRLESLPLHLGFKAFEKVDGSLGCLYRHNGEFRIATRGSFYSDQAKKATEMLKRYDLTSLSPDVTLLFEIIYPENKIVVNYGSKEELTLLAVFDYRTESELPWDQVELIAQQCGFTLPKVYNHTLDELVEMAKTIPFQEEGWVLRFENGLRVKVKGADYLRIAKIKSHMSPLAFWEAFLERKAEEYLASIPEELREEAEEIYGTLKHQVGVLKQKAELEVQNLNLRAADLNDKDLLKQIAFEIQKRPDWMVGYLFQTLRQKESEVTLIKLLRPTENVYTNLEKFK